MHANKQPLFKYQGQNYLFPFILLTTLFFMWGLANNMTDTLLAAFKKIMSMSDFQTSWIQIAFYGSYFCLALPAAFFIKKYTYKAGILLGLAMFIIGSLLFFPASRSMAYGHFLAALFLLAGGLSVLETTANPFVIILGAPENATRRLNLAQSFNPFGSIAGIALSKVFILPNLDKASAVERSEMAPKLLATIQAAELKAVMEPYVGVGLFLLGLWLIIAISKMPKALDAEQTDGFQSALTRLYKNKNYRMGVIAQFFYVGAQIGVWSFTIRYVMQELNLNEAASVEYYLVSLIAFTVARFLFTGLMKYFQPGKLLTISALLAMFSSVIVVFGHGFIAVFSLVSISAFMSLMFPTIFGSAVQGLGTDTKIGGSGLIMAILGGAVLTAIQGQVSDLTGNIHYSYLVPFLCFLVIFYYGMNQKKYLAARQ